MSVTTREFGKNAEGRIVTQYILTNKQGANVKIIDFGATVTSICVPDQDGMMDDVVCGFDTMDGYLADHGHMGEAIGRYGNRIALGRFMIDGKEYQVAQNDGVNHLHGGDVGFGVRMWDATVIEAEGEDTVVFHLISPDGEENYPGTVDVTVSYSWNDHCDLNIRYRATTDQPTLLNMTNHSYFNLAGHDHGTIRDQVLYVDADAINKVDAGLIPTGAYYPVAQTPFDLREGRLLGDCFDEMDDEPMMKRANGIDHNYILRKGTAFGLAAALHDEGSGRTMEVLTDQPGIQVYSANMTNIPGGKDGVFYGKHSAVCLETQHAPDSPNNPQWPTTVLRPGEIYDTTTIYAFRVDPDTEE